MRKEKISTESAKIQTKNVARQSAATDTGIHEPGAAAEQARSALDLLTDALGEAEFPEPLIPDRFDIHKAKDMALAVQLNDAYETAYAVSELATVVRANLLECSPIYNALAPRQVGALLSAISLLGNSLADSLDRLADTIEKRTAEKKGGA